MQKDTQLYVTSFKPIPLNNKLYIKEDLVSTCKEKNSLSPLIKILFGVKQHSIGYDLQQSIEITLKKRQKEGLDYEN